MINTIKRILAISIIGIVIAGIAYASYPQYWNFNDNLIPRTTNSYDIGSTTNRIKKIWTTDLDTSGIFTLGGTVGTGGIDLNGEALYLDPDKGMYMQASVNDLLGIMGGNVGIGTTTPLIKLDVASDSAYNQDGTFAVKTTVDDNWRMFMGYDRTLGAGYIQAHKRGVDTSPILLNPSGGNVGIGTTSPGGKLHIVGTSRFDGSMTFLDPINDHIYGPYGIVTDNAYSFNSDANTGIYHPSDDQMGFSTAGTEAMRIDSSGNVGIGDTSPDYKLEVLAVTTQLALTYSDGIDSSFTVDSNGDLRIEATGGDVVVDAYLRPTKVWHAYGGFEDEGYTLTCDPNTWTFVTNADNTLWGGTQQDGVTMTADEMIITNTGDYTGSVTITISAVTGKDFHLRIYNVTQSRVEGFPLGVSTTGAGNKTPITIPVYIKANASDVLRLQINSADGTDPVLQDGLFIVKYLHE